MSNEITVNAGNFEDEVLRSSVPVLIDFWASWCQPCKMISPFIDEIAGEYAGRLKVVKINVDEEGDLAGRHGIISIPTLILYKDGNVVNQRTGAAPKHDIEALFRDFV
ncbi:MAG TPA: thioredoxin [Treponema sp.]|nr:thioredoxin [Treponema sp.]